MMLFSHWLFWLKNWRFLTNTCKGFIASLKDHKADFTNSLPCELINPRKSDIEVDLNVEQERTKSFYQSDWCNIKTVTDWFKSISNKPKAWFLKFNIVEFYPPITKRLLHIAVSYVKTLPTKPEDNGQLIEKARKSILFTKGNLLIKNVEMIYFVMTMRLHHCVGFLSLLVICLTAELSNKIN